MIDFKKKSGLKLVTTFFIASILTLTSCIPVDEAAQPSVPLNLTPTTQATAVESTPTPLPTRPAYTPGTLVDYIAQSGDTLPALASHFNTKVSEIRAANPVIPQDVTTLPEGFPMKIPIYYQTLWGSPFHVLPDSAFVNGPSLGKFSAAEFVKTQPGWLKDYKEYAAEKNRTGGEIVDYVSENFSISPQLLLALLEYQAGALSQPAPDGGPDPYLLGYNDTYHQGVFLQLVWAANTLNNAYYKWRLGQLASFEHPDGSIERPDPWQNTATVALDYYFSRFLPNDAYTQAVNSQGILRTFTKYFSDPWSGSIALIPGNLRQPPMRLPFKPGKTWAYTGGPHTGWGTGEPFAAIDFAPGASVGGCNPTTEWAVAVADGVVARTDKAVVVLDLDGDGNERTGWVMFYLHLATSSMVKEGDKLKAGDPVGYPSCEGGNATGTHVHIARKYNGEWILAGGLLAFNLEGWVVRSSEDAYQGSLERLGQILTACDCSDRSSQIQSTQP